MNPPEEHRRRLAASRESVLEAIGASEDVTFVRGVGNLGDELIWSGARRLLAGVARREVSIEELGATRGEVAVLSGSGALCRPWHEWKPHAIAVAELRYRRVVVLPSSVDVGEDRVREALARARAVVFARERESLRAMQGLCDTRLALDCAFFHDFSPYAGVAGSGTLSAFRTDAERRDGSEEPPGNEDISTYAASLDAWLGRVAGAERVRTDRAHVMIAAALLGKPVEYASSSYHKVDAIAAYSLSGFPVSRLPAPGEPDAREARSLRPGLGHRWRRGRSRRRKEPGVRAVIATRDRPAAAVHAARSALAQGAEAVVVDANSAPRNRESLARALGDEGARVLSLDRDLGRGGARVAGLADEGGELVLLLDEDAALERGALKALVDQLARDPRAAAVSATMLTAGVVEHSGGAMTRDGDVAHLEPLGAGEAIRDGTLPPTGTCAWAPHSALLVRAEALAAVPLACDVRGVEDQEWALRAEAKGLRVLRSSEAFAERLPRGPVEHAVPFAERMRRLELADAIARVRERRGVVLADVFAVLPELGGSIDRARILLSLLRADGPHRVLAAWDAGELDLLLAGSP